MPDGATPESHALTHRNVEQVTLTAKTAPDDTGEPVTTHMVLIPGSQCGLAVWQTKGTAFEIVGQAKYFKWNSDTYWSGRSQPQFDGTAGDPPGSDPQNPNNVDSLFTLEGSINKWRMVSQALRMSLINTYEENDGWWEAVRLNYKPVMTHWEIYSNKNTGILPTKPAGDIATAISSTADRPYLRPNETFMDAVAGKNMAEHKSYTCGALKDLHTKQFNIAPYSGSREFVDVRQNYQLPANAVRPMYLSGLDSGRYIFRPGYTQADDIFNAGVDHNHDLTYIRVHPGNHDVNLLCDLVCHQEVCYDLDSPLAKFMTQNSKNAKAITDQAAQIKSLQDQLAASDGGSR